MNLNVINDPWLFVKYLDGTIKQISVRQAFIDAEKIENIETPTFHGIKVYIYDVPVIQFLVTILLAAYFKPETNFKARKQDFCKCLFEDGWDLDLILAYLDKWQDRFNIKDSKYPFLQDIRLESIIDYDNTNLEKYVTKLNICSPNIGNAVFEHNTENGLNLNDFIPTIDELVYLLLYFSALGTSINADNFPGKSLTANSTLFVLNYSNNLFKTILMNTLPLRDSQYVDTNTGEYLEYYDKPIWELDHRNQALTQYDISSVFQNRLLCSFFPSLPLFVGIKNNNVVDFVFANRKHANEKECIVDKSIRETIAEKYMFYNIYGILYELTDNDQTMLSYKNWSPSTRLINLCITMTKQLSKGFACQVITSDLKASTLDKTVVYYREYDKYKCNMLSFGKYEIEKFILDDLQVAENHAKAEYFQNLTASILAKFNILKECIDSHLLELIKLQFSNYSEQYFKTQFILDIQNEHILEITTKNLIDFSKNLVKNNSEFIKNPVQFAKAYAIFSSSLNKLLEECK